MALPLSRPPVRALTASASKLGRSDESAYQKRLGLPEQYRALSYYDQIGEIRFASQFYAKLLSRVRFFPATLEEDGSLTPIESGLPVELLDRIQDPGGGKSQIQYDYGRLMFITGEGFLFGYRLDTDDERWKFLWKDEIKIRDDGMAVRLNPEKKETGDVGIAYRFWTPHPRQSDIADSPIMPVMDICEELIALTLSVMATATTRMTNGVIVMPSEAIPIDPNTLGEEDAENNVFLSDYIEHVQTQLGNPGSSEAKVPFLYTPPYEFADRFRWVPTHDPQTDYMEKDLRVEAIKRLGLGMDFNPEFLLGMTDANHWTAKQVVHDQWRTHGVSVANRFAGDLNQVYLRPALIVEEYGNWKNVVIGMDDSQVVISPDRTEDADKAYDRGMLGDPGYRELKGIPESMKPSEEEKELWTAIKMREPALLPGEDGIAIQQRGPEPSTNGGSPAEDGPPEPGTRTGSRQESRTASAHILGAADLALMRCRELAGMRIRHKDKDAAPGVPASLVASVVGAERVTDPLKFVRGGTDAFQLLLEERGFGNVLAESLCQTLEVYAARTVFEPRQPDLPAGFVAQVERAREVSDAMVD